MEYVKIRRTQNKKAAVLLCQFHFPADVSHKYSSKRFNEIFGGKIVHLPFSEIFPV